MAHSIVIELQMPNELKQFRLPKDVNRRLQELLDKPSREGKLSRAERQEAEGLVNLAEMLSLLKLRAERGARSTRAVKQIPVFSAVVQVNLNAVTRPLTGFGSP